MAIPVVCDGCDSRFQVKDELAGKLVRCRGCSEPVRVSKGRSPKRSAVEQLDELEDWDESEDEWDDRIESPIAPRKKVKASKSKKKSKSRHAESLLALVGYFKQIEAVDVLPLMTWGSLAIFFLMFLIGFLSPVVAQYFVIGNLLTRGFLCMCCTLGFLGVAVKENPICLLLCLLFPIYSLWYVISRWDRCAQPIGILLTVMFLGSILDYGAQAAYESAGIDWKSANTAVSWTFRR